MTRLLCDLLDGTQGALEALGLADKRARIAQKPTELCEVDVLPPRDEGGRVRGSCDLVGRVSEGPDEPDRTFYGTALPLQGLRALGPGRRSTSHKRRHARALPPRLELDAEPPRRPYGEQHRPPRPPARHPLSVGSPRRCRMSLGFCKPALVHPERDRSLHDPRGHVLLSRDPAQLAEPVEQRDLIAREPQAQRLGTRHFAHHNQVKGRSPCKSAPFSGAACLSRKWTQVQFRNKHASLACSEGNVARAAFPYSPPWPNLHAS